MWTLSKVSVYLSEYNMPEIQNKLIIQFYGENNASDIKEALQTLNTNEDIIGFAFANHTVPSNLIDYVIEEAAHKIHILTLFSTQITSDNINKISKLISAKSLLKVLNIYNDNIGDQGSEIIAEALKSPNNLETLTLVANGIGVKGTYSIWKALPENTTLKTLKLISADSNIPSPDVMDIAAAMALNTTLTHLDLTSSNLHIQQIVELAEGLRTNSTLNKLILSDNEVSDAGAIALSKAIVQNEQSTLTCLNLQNTKIQDQGVIAVGSMLAIKPEQITELYLQRNEFTDLGWAALIYGFAKSVNLPSLTASSNKGASYQSTRLYQSAIAHKASPNREPPYIPPEVMEQIQAMSNSLKERSTFQGREKSI